MIGSGKTNRSLRTTDAPLATRAVIVNVNKKSRQLKSAGFFVFLTQLWQLSRRDLTEQCLNLAHLRELAHIRR